MPTLRGGSAPIAARPEPLAIPVETRHGAAVAHVHRAAGHAAGSPAAGSPAEQAPVQAGDGAPPPRGAVVLGHGAGGGVAAPDLVAVTAAATAAGFLVVLVEQPYRVAGRRVPPRAPVLDGAWLDVLAQLGAGPLAGLPLVVGGRSSGARVACRTAADAGAAGVLCLAFPLRPPSAAGGPEKPSRLPELEQVAVPVLVVQGERDPFGVPPDADGRTVVTVAGDHGLKKDLGAVRGAADAWLRALPLEPAPSA